ncbi:Uncharacterized protein FWK35_00013160 [Aphis craccivora]|uniref:Uncharacterized protein n=1 Tax=Aphis craccivora TaxID=307492 RepID=A0A6G0YTM0_APHCR|nr:Uncharacterized protein FWK35_00013160 [Aphis craccivora]
MFTQKTFWLLHGKDRSQTTPFALYWIFSTKSIFLYGCNSKTNHCKNLKFSPNVYVSVIYIQPNFQNILTFFDVDKKILDDQEILKIKCKVPYEFSVYSSNFYVIRRKRENLQRNDNDLSSNDIKVDKFFSAQKKSLKI